MTTEKTLVLPTSSNSNQTTELKTKGSFILIGANGSGKTRLGTWIELKSPQDQQAKVHRISAQKSLSMPNNTTIQPINKAKKELLFGLNELSRQISSSKAVNRWKRKPETHLLDDYQALITYLFSDHIEAMAKYRNMAKTSLEIIDPLLTKLDLVQQVWEAILPHRELIVGGLDIKTKVKGTTEQVYKCSEMSDGERVIFYLIGQCLAVPENGIVIIDEPELHLQKSIQAPLWTEIEKLRSDCLFVYLTHDVDFAAAQVNGDKIWLKSYDGNNWEWEKIEQVDNFPEDLLIQILGSRKPIVFVEGENGKFDVTLYRSILDKFLVIPRGSCTQVIQSVKALKSSPQLHHLEVHGLIDRDRRTDSEIQALVEKGIYVLEVAEVENLFCTPEVLEFLSQKLSRDAEKDLKQVKDFIFNEFSKELETQISLRTSSEIRSKLNSFANNPQGEVELQQEFDRIIQSINTSDIYNSTKQSFQKIIDERNYDNLLRYYNRKSLATRICGVFGLKNDQLRELIIRYTQNSDRDRDAIKNKLKQYFGAFTQHLN